MILKNGKFYDSAGQVVPLEFGNNDQIKLLEKAKELKDGIIVLFNHFTCLCGHDLPWPAKAMEESETINRTCPSCGIKYQFYVYDDEVPCIRMK